MGTTAVTQKREKKAAVGDWTRAVAMNLLTEEDNAKEGGELETFTLANMLAPVLGMCSHAFAEVVNF